MFEIARRRTADPLSELMTYIANDPFFRRPLAGLEDDGGIAVDLSEKDGKLVVRANLPGFKREEIDVQVHKGVLTVRAEHTEESEVKDEKFFRRERRYGSVGRSIALPGNVTDEHVDAAFENGVLTLAITQPEVARPKKVAIK
ncbi:MAG: Hsp20/alpha crystallin family protein [Phycisphaerales bacterium]